MEASAGEAQGRREKKEEKKGGRKALSFPLYEV